MMKKQKAILLAVLFYVAIPILGAVQLPTFFNSGMVLQRESDCRIWGTSDSSGTLTITTSWDNKTQKVKIARDGKWSAILHTPTAGGPYTIRIDDGNLLVLDNILIGELWICSGQSNMEMPMKGYKNQPVEGASEAILHSRNPALRLFTVKRQASFEPQTDVSGEWSEATPENVREFSATAYYFGRLLHEMLDVPVGLIVTSWGGSACEAWLNRDWFEAFPTITLPTNQADVDKTKQRCPTALYNGMLHPLVGLRIAGAIWYQGEDNWPRYQNYAKLFSTMVRGWRSEFGQGEFPFYYCQIAPYDYDLITAADADTICSAYLREQQFLAETMIPNCGMAVLMDAGLEKGIHPMKKQVAGERLARLALVKTYGLKGVTAESPRYDHIEISNDTVTVFFNHADMWINCHGCYESKLFEVAGADRVFHPAKAWVNRSKMMVRSDEVPHPVAVRYAFRNYVEGDVFCEDLPLSSFRSDDW